MPTICAQDLDTEKNNVPNLVKLTANKAEQLKNNKLTDNQLQSYMLH